jgi:short-subunit dehydrogenase
MNYPKLPSFRLDGKRALVTGAGRGIGMGASIALAESGANVTLVSRTEKELKDLTDHINSQGFKASYEVLDVNNEDEVSNFINNAEPFDILINNAGTNRPAKLIDTKIEDFDYVMSLNVRSVISLTKLVVKKMLDSNIKGSIINVSSQMGHVGGPNRTTYCSICSPSTVITSFFSHSIANKLHESFFSPSIITAQLPHCSRPQPSLVPVNPKSSLMT